MYSKRKPIGYNVGNEIIKQKKLTFICFILTFICIIWNVWDNKNTWVFYRQPISVADMLIDLQHASRFGIMMFPIMLFFILRCKQDSLNLQIVLRYGSRSRMLWNQLAESCVYALGMSTILVLLESVIGFCFLGEWINWNSVSSRFYINTGFISDLCFGEIAAAVWLMYILKYLLILFLMDMLLWYQKYLSLIWIPVLLAYALDLPILELCVFHNLYSIQYSYAISRTELLLPLLIGTLLLIAEYLIGTIFIKKKDILQ